MFKRRALLVGINYVGTQSALNGCWNDVHGVEEYLKTYREYADSDITVMTDEPTSAVKPTRDNIMSSLTSMLFSDATTIYFHYTGHGSYISDINGDEKDGRDETLVPLDYQRAGMITDDDIRAILSLVGQNKRITMVLDCCHSGTGVDLAYNVCKRANKYITMRDTSYQPTKAFVMMLSGCLDSQTSADAYIDNKYQGALTASFLSALKTGKISTYEELLVTVKSILKEDGYKQTPSMSFGRQTDMKSSLTL